MGGCMRVGTEIAPDDPRVVFTSIYCAPEFARFAIGSGRLVVSPCLDVWSVGMIVAELVNLRPLLRAQYRFFSSRGSPDQFLRWLGSVQVLPLPERTKARDQDLSALLSAFLLEADAAHRKTLAQTLAASYFQPRARKSAVAQANASLRGDAALMTSSRSTQSARDDQAAG
jgi:serine/threonine protein kinase